MKLEDTLSDQALVGLGLSLLFALLVLVAFVFEEDKEGPDLSEPPQAMLMLTAERGRLDPDEASTPETSSERDQFTVFGSPCPGWVEEENAFQESLDVAMRGCR